MVTYTKCIKLATDDSRNVHDMKNMRDVTYVYGLFHIFYAASQNKFLVSCVLNHLVVEAVIMHETKGFSRAIWDKITVEKENRIAKHL